MVRCAAAIRNGHPEASLATADHEFVLRLTAALAAQDRQCGLQQPDAVAGVAVDIEDVHQQRVLVPRPRPPSGPGHHAITALGEPQPFRAAATGRQVATDLFVEDVRQAVEQVKLIRPGDRAQGQVMLMQNQGILRPEAPRPFRDQLSWLPREDTSTARMAYMTQPSFLHGSG
jgi:hypothetical protein